MNHSNNLIAALESKIDHLETELSYLNRLLQEVGFSEGITTLKQTAEELLRETSPTHSPLSLD